MTRRLRRSTVSAPVRPLRVRRRTSSPPVPVSNRRALPEASNVWRKTMKVQSFNLLRSVVAGALVLLLLAPIAQAAPRQTVPDQQPQTEPQTAPTTSGDLPQ